MRAGCDRCGRCVARALFAALTIAIALVLPPAAASAQTPDPHAGHAKPTPAAPSGTAQEPGSLPPFIPPATDEDRKAAFPDVDGHPTRDNDINYFVLFDQLEWERGRSDQGFGWDTKGWVGRDRDRVWFRTEGQYADETVVDAQSHVFYGRAISRWWDVVAGIRQDFDPGPAQTWAAVGIQGLAPYWFNVEATAYLGANARNHYRFETEYEFLLTNRLVLQPMAEMEIYGKPDLEHERDKGLATLDFGFRLRYLIRRELAPYVGVVWHQKHFGTADIARANGESTGGARLVAGVRFWL
jgi:copper resistance protein B